MQTALLSQDQSLGRYASTMAKLITFCCPQTGMDVQAFLHTQEKAERAQPTYEAVKCTACTRLHFMDTVTGKALGSDK